MRMIGVVFGVLLAVPMMADEPPKVLQIYRESLNVGEESTYKAIEDETVLVCVDLKCPHPHMALESIVPPTEVWWLNAFASDEERERVEEAYRRNRPLMSALERNSARKALVTGPPVNVYTFYRPGLSRGASWTLIGARFVVATVTRGDTGGEGSVFETADGVRYVLKPVRTRAEADVEAAARGPNARILAVRPDWGMPAHKWIAADPEFWKVNPLCSHHNHPSATATRRPAGPPE